MAAETCTGRCKFSDVIDTEFVIDANKDRGHGQHLQCVWSKSFATRSSFFLVKSSEDSRIIQKSLKYSLKIVANTVNSGQLINQGNPNV